MATKDLTITWTKPTSGGKPDTYIVQGRKGTSGAWTTLVDKVTHSDTDPQKTTILKADLDKKLTLVAGDTLQVQVAGVNKGGTGPYSDPGDAVVPPDVPNKPGKPTLTWG